MSETTKRVAVGVEIRRPRYERLLYSEEEVTQRINEMAVEVVRRYKGQRVLFVALLKGALPFADRLMAAITRYDPEFDPDLELIGLSRYGASREASETQVTVPLPPGYEDLSSYDRVALVEDMIDEGKTIKDARDYLSQHGAKADRIDAIVLVRKQKNPPTATPVTMVGFDNVPDRWLTGMGCDDERLGHEANRWAGYIAIANAD